MALNFSIFPDEYFPKNRAISMGSSIEARAVEAFFRNRARFGTTLKELEEDYKQDESACLGFMGPEAFAFFLPMFMKFAVFEYDEAGTISASLVYGLHGMATEYTDDCSDEQLKARFRAHYRDQIKAILSTYSRNQRSIVVGFLHEMSRIEWPCYDPDLALEAAQLLREKFGLPERRTHAALRTG